MQPLHFVCRKLASYCTGLELNGNIYAMAYPRTRNIFDPESSVAYKLSRSKIENLLRCARCFYLDRRLGVSQPSGPPFNLNSLVDVLLKKEFDVHRAGGTPHPLMAQYKIDAVPYPHEDLDKWRENFVGVQYLHKPTNLLITGAVDDVWVNPAKELIVVDYKATSKVGEVEFDDSTWYNSYRRQMEIYQWLLRQNGFAVSNAGYFVSCNGDTDREAFDGKIEFKMKLIEHIGDDLWVEDAIIRAKACLMSNGLPECDPECEYCQYRKASKKVEK